MRFISREKSPGFIMKHAAREIVETNMGNILTNRPPAHLKFEPLSVPFRTSALPIKSYKDYASGTLNTKSAADKLRRAGHKWTEKSETGEEVDVTEKVVIDFLFSHPNYGKDFVGIGDNGVEILDTVIIPEGDGGWYCRLCEKHFENAQGKEGHIAGSKEHKQNVEGATKKAVLSIA